MAGGWLPSLLPIVGAGIGCSRSRPVGDAIVDLRLLHQPPSGGTRLIGYVRPPETFTGGFVPPSPSHFVARAQIRIAGPAGTRIVSTGQSGVYRVDDLAPGDYTLTLLTRDHQLVGWFNVNSSPTKVHLDPWSAGRAQFRTLLEWTN